MKRKLIYVAVTLALAMGAGLAVLAAADLYLHRKYSLTGGYNVWGYRGPVVGGKSPGEWRAVMLGGSVALGYGASADQTIPAWLERKLTTALAPRQRSASVVNLGWNSEGAHSFRYTVGDYAYLDYDAAILYSGYNDLVFNDQVYRHQSGVFRLTGYLPILPMILAEKVLVLKYGTDQLNNFQRGERAVFTGTLIRRSAAAAAASAYQAS